MPRSLLAPRPIPSRRRCLAEREWASEHKKEIHMQGYLLTVAPRRSKPPKSFFSLTLLRLSRIVTNNLTIRVHFGNRHVAVVWFVVDGTRFVFMNRQKSHGKKSGIITLVKLYVYWYYKQYALFYPSGSQNTVFRVIPAVKWGIPR